MNIVILGKGNMGRPLAILAEKAGHTVRAFGSQDDAVEALKTADLVVIATRYEQALALAAQPGVAGALAGKVVIDITNPLATDFMSLTVGHTTSAAETIAARLQGARLIKAFSTIFAAVLAKRAEGEHVAVPVFVAGDDAAAVDIVARLATTFGLQAVKAGPLTNARYLEPMAELMVQFGYGLGHGDGIGFALVQAA